MVVHAGVVDMSRPQPSASEVMESESVTSKTKHLATEILQVCQLGRAATRGKHAQVSVFEVAGQRIANAALTAACDEIDLEVIVACRGVWHLEVTAVCI